VILHLSDLRARLVNAPLILHFVQSNTGNQLLLNQRRKTHPQKMRRRLHPQEMRRRLPPQKMRRRLHPQKTRRTQHQKLRK